MKMKGKSGQDRRLPASCARFAGPFFMSLLMCAVVSFIATWRGAGMTDKFAGLWLGSWFMSWLVAFPALLLFQPVVQKLVAWCCRPD